MKVRYEKQVDPRASQFSCTSRPIVRGRLFLGGRHQAVFALIDSGADVTLFHSSLGKALGIDIQTGREGRVFGISGEQMPIYYHKLKLQPDGAAQPTEIDVGFVDSPGVGALLGQAGFFEHFRICFDRSKEEIEIRATRQQLKPPQYLA